MMLFRGVRFGVGGWLKPLKAIWRLLGHPKGRLPHLPPPLSMPLGAPERLAEGGGEAPGAA